MGVLYALIEPLPFHADKHIRLLTTPADSVPNSVNVGVVRSQGQVSSRLDDPALVGEREMSDKGKSRGKC